MNLFGQLVQRLPAALATPERRERPLAYTELVFARATAAEDALPKHHAKQELAELARLPKPFEPVYRAGTSEKSGLFALMVAMGLAPLLASRDEEIQHGCTCEMKAYTPPGLCCTSPVRDLSCQASVIAGGHAETGHTFPQDAELARV